MGMLTGWFLLQIVTFLFFFSGHVFRAVRYGALPFERLIDDAGRNLIVVGGCSAVLCLIAWCLIYLPVYWFWPRCRESWIGNFTAVGAVAGGVIGFLFCLCLQFHDHELLEMSGMSATLILMPLLVGTVSAWTGWRFEEKERRFLEWQKRMSKS